MDRKRTASNLGDAIDITVMSIREHLIDYYKQGCDFVLPQSNVVVHRKRASASHNYEREDFELHRPSYLCLRLKAPHFLVLADLEREPDTAVLHSLTLDRSKALRGVRQGIEAFFSSYLPYVTVTAEKTGSRDDWKGDAKLLAANLARPIATAKKTTITPDQASVIDTLNSACPNGNSGNEYIFNHHTYLWHLRTGWCVQDESAQTIRPDIAGVNSITRPSNVDRSPFTFLQSLDFTSEEDDD